MSERGDRERQDEAEDGACWVDMPPVERARLRARGRSRLQELGETEAALAEAGISLEAAGCIVRPHERLPYGRERDKARGRQLAREHGW